MWVVPAGGLLQRLKRGQFWGARLDAGQVRRLGKRAEERFRPRSEV